MITHLYADLETATRGIGFQLFRDSDVAFAIGGMFEHLPIVIAIAFGGFDLTWIFNGEELTFFTQFHLPGCSKGNYDVITFPKWKISKLTLERATAFMHPPGFIRL